MNTSFPEGGTASHPSKDRSQDKQQHHSRQRQQHQHQHQPHHQQQQQQHSRLMSTLLDQQHAPSFPHQYGGGVHLTSMSQSHQSRFQGHPTHHYISAQQQHAPPQQQMQQPQHQYSAHQHQHAQPQAQAQQQQQTQQQGAAEAQQPPPLERAATNQGFSVPRTMTAPPGWVSSANPAVHLHSSGVSAAAPSGSSSSSSSGSMLSYWDHGAASDNELMTSAMTSSDPHHALSDVSGGGGGGGGHHRYASVASLPSGVAAGGPSSHSYVGSEHYHPYRPASMSMAGPTYHSSHHQQSSLGSGMTYAPVSGQLATASSGLVYGGSSSSMGTPYDASYSQYVSYLPPAHESRFYPLNPFEIKHRRRTTKTQFRVLESTFREIPKPNATLRKQISAQLDMPVRAVQIWFQNRRAKAKALEKKKSAATSATGGGGGDEPSRAPSGVVGAASASHHAYSGEERYAATGSSGQQQQQQQQQQQHPHQQQQQQYDHRQSGRMMDLPPIRIGGEDGYLSTPTNTTAPTLPSIDSSSLRDRRQLPPPIGVPMLPASLAMGMPSTHPEANPTDDSSTLSAAGDRSSRACPPREQSLPTRYEPNRFWSTPQP